MPTLGRCKPKCAATSLLPISETPTDSVSTVSETSSADPAGRYTKMLKPVSAKNVYAFSTIAMICPSFSLAETSYR
jgi:hypothetical protein